MERTPRRAYDEHADWYAGYLVGAAARHTARTAAAVSLALGPGLGLCLDLGCGTGIHANAIRGLGWTLIGVDVSQAQLRHARHRMPVVVGDTARLPVRSGSIDAAVGVMIHTDVDSWTDTLAEANRVLRRGGRFVYVGAHPCFVGPFAERSGANVLVHPGYGEAGLVFEGPGMGDGIRSKVGVHNRSLATILNAVADADLRLLHLAELADETVPDLLVLTAVKPEAAQ
jgi:SAM-dependent methyltransferase